ncbi:hypothetical protein ACLOJK_028892, partial [Asimina triloba]
LALSSKEVVCSDIMVLPLERLRAGEEEAVIPVEGLRAPPEVAGLMGVSTLKAV